MYLNQNSLSLADDTYLKIIYNEMKRTERRFRFKSKEIFIKNFTL